MKKITLNRSAAMLALSATVSLSIAVGVAVAGEWIYGSGYNRAAAMENAEKRAHTRSIATKTCYRPASPDRCVKEEDGAYTCRVEVTHHTHSGGGMCPS